MRMISLTEFSPRMAAAISWEERLAEAKNAGFDFVEISIDETDAKLARLDWTGAERLELLKTMDKVGLPIRSMCLSGHRKYPLGSPDDATRAPHLFTKSANVYVRHAEEEVIGHYTYVKSFIAEDLVNFRATETKAE